MLYTVLKKNKKISLSSRERLSGVFTNFLSDQPVGNKSGALYMIAGSGGETFTFPVHQHQRFQTMRSKCVGKAEGVQRSSI